MIGSLWSWIFNIFLWICARAVICKIFLSHIEAKWYKIIAFDRLNLEEKKPQNLRFSIFLQNFTLVSPQYLIIANFSPTLLLILETDHVLDHQPVCNDFVENLIASFPNNYLKTHWTHYPNSPPSLHPSISTFIISEIHIITWELAKRGVQKINLVVSFDLPVYTDMKNPQLCGSVLPAWPPTISKVIKPNLQR